MPYPLNLILYGPPGTGKTYHTVTHAVAIIEGRSVTEVRQEAEASDNGRQQVRNRFADYHDQGQVAFVTFHQAFSYEDFVEGIKPLTTDSGGIVYDILPGIFWRMANDAAKMSRRAASAQPPQLTADLEDEFDDLYEAFCADVRHRLDLQGNVFFTSKNGKRIKVERVDPNNTVVVSHPDSRYLQARAAAVLHPIGARWIKNLYERYESVNAIEQSYRDIRASGGPNASAQFAIFAGLLEFEQQRHSTATPAAEQPATLEVSAGGTVPRFVLIIDEINRGNVANIFGELITLLEADKRAGQPEATTVRLPYSKLPFSVPDNLYLLGTMNTADRSVEALDTALRRRFSFTEMRPEPGLLSEEVEGINVRQMLYAINDRLEQLLDHDHCLGHALLMGAKDFDGLREAFRRNILPLLQEYFFGDWGKIGLVLGKDFLRVDSQQQDRKHFKPLAFGDYQAGDLTARQVYQLVVPTDKKVFQAIYA